MDSRPTNQENFVTVLSVPQRYQSGLVQLADLQPEVADALADGFAELPEFAPVDKLVPLVEAASRLDAQDAVQLIATLISVVRLVEPPDLTVAKVIAEVSESSDLELSTEQRERLSVTLGKLIDKPTLIAIAKAGDMTSEFPSTFSHARILSDIRPVFVGTAEEAPTGALIVHTLKIEHFTSGNWQQFFVTLDNEDLLSLRKTIDRAEQKTVSLKSVIDSAGLRCFEEGEGDLDS